MSASYLHGGEWVDPADYADPAPECLDCGNVLEDANAGEHSSVPAERYCAECWAARLGDES